MRDFFSNPRTRTILLLVFSVISILILIGRALFMTIQGIIAYDLTPFSSSALNAFGMLCCAILFIPLLAASIRQLKGIDQQQKAFPLFKTRYLLLLGNLWVVMIVIASLMTRLFDLGWIFAAPAFVLAMLIPAATTTWIGAGGLITSPRRRLWAALGLGMTGSTGIALVLEYLVVGLALLVGAGVVLFNPEFGTLVEQIQSQLANAGSMEKMLAVLGPYITNPWIFLLLLIFAAVLTPLIEEAAKPLAVWLLGRNIHSPAEGFALGAIGGAGFALLEGLMASSMMSEALYFGLPARAASTWMHITLSAIMGWGIASTMLEKRVGKLIGAYLLCGGVHGLWNGSALLAVYGSLRFTLQGMGSPDYVSVLLILAGISILGLVLVAVSILLPVLNQKLRKAQSDIIAPPTPGPEKDSHGLDFKDF